MPDVAAIHAALRRRGATVAVAESLTGGLLSAALSATPGASATFRGGLVVYATDLKHKLAGVGSHLLDAVGAVDANVASELARGAHERLIATYGVGVTGVAGPEPQDGRAVGTVFVSVCTSAGGITREHHFTGSRDEIRAAAVEAALELLAAECR